MSVRDEIRRGLVEAFYDSPKHEVSPDVFRRDAAALVRLWRLAPLVEYSEQLAKAIDSEEVIDAAFAEREAAMTVELIRLVHEATDELLEELLATRRELARVTGRLAALEAAVFPVDPDEPDLDDEPDLAVGASSVG